MKQGIWRKGLIEVVILRVWTYKITTVVSSYKRTSLGQLRVEERIGSQFYIDISDSIVFSLLKSGYDPLTSSSVFDRSPTFHFRNITGKNTCKITRTLNQKIKKDFTFVAITVNHIETENFWLNKPFIKNTESWLEVLHCQPRLILKCFHSNSNHILFVYCSNLVRKIQSSLMSKEFTVNKFEFM